MINLHTLRLDIDRLYTFDRRELSGEVLVVYYSKYTNQYQYIEPDETVPIELVKDKTVYFVDSHTMLYKDGDVIYVIDLGIFVNQRINEEKLYHLLLKGITFKDAINFMNTVV